MATSVDSLRPFLVREAQSAPAPFASRDFVKLRAEWYRKLEASGFVDAERQSTTGYDGRLGREYARGMPREELYRLAGWWLHDRVWARRSHKYIFERWADGVEYRAIARLLSPMRRVGRDAVRDVVATELAALRAFYVERGS